MKTNRNKKPSPAAPVERARASLKRRWQTMRIRSQGEYPDWMMYISNPLPGDDFAAEEASGWARIAPDG